MSELEGMRCVKNTHRKALPKARLLRNSCEMTFRGAGAAGAGVTDTCSQGHETECWCSLLCSKGTC